MDRDRDRRDNLENPPANHGTNEQASRLCTSDMCRQTARSATHIPSAGRRCFWRTALHCTVARASHPSSRCFRRQCDAVVDLYWWSVGEDELALPQAQAWNGTAFCVIVGQLQCSYLSTFVSAWVNLTWTPKEKEADPYLFMAYKAQLHTPLFERRDEASRHICTAPVSAS